MEARASSISAVIAVRCRSSRSLNSLSRAVRSEASVAAEAACSLHLDQDGEPAAIVNRSASFTLADGHDHRQPPLFNSDSWVDLEPGVAYWIACAIAEPAGADLVLFAQPDATDGNTRVGLRAFGTPTALSPGDTSPGAVRVSIYAQVEAR